VGGEATFYYTIPFSFCEGYVRTKKNTPVSVLELSTMLSQGPKHKHHTGEKHKTHWRAAPSDVRGHIVMLHSTQSGAVVVMSTLLLCLSKVSGLILDIGEEALGTPLSLVSSDAFRDNVALAITR
jgi:hypothetical protein